MPLEYHHLATCSSGPTYSTRRDYKLFVSFSLFGLCTLKQRMLFKNDLFSP